MKLNIVALFLITALAGLVSGCVETVDGHSQAGVPFVKDSVEGRYERSVKQVEEAARAVIKFNGTLIADNSINNSINGIVNRKEVFVRVDQIDPVKPVSRIIVEVRSKSGGADVDLAHDLEKQVAIYLATH